MTPKQLTTFDRHAAFVSLLERDRELAWETANYEREQRDQYTSKLRFGSVTLNAVSLITVLNGATLFPGLGRAALLTSAAAFVAGVISAGVSLVAHQTHLIEMSGFARARALAVDRAVNLSKFPPGSAEYERVDDALRQSHDLYEQMMAPKYTPVYLQNWSMALWLVGVFFVASGEIGAVAADLFG